MKILIVEDDPRQAEQIGESFRGEIRYAVAYEEAVSQLESFSPDVVILDAVFPLRHGRNQVASFMADRFLDTLDEIYDAKFHRRPDVVLISGQEQAVQQVPVVGEWLRSGKISDVLPKGVGWNFFRAVLSEKVERLLERRRLSGAFSDVKGAFASLHPHGIITQHPEMALVWRRLVQAAQSGMHTFVYGEVGVGKEPAVRAIAALRNRSLHKFLCGRPAGTFAADLFGSVVGAFTGAINKQGSIELAGSNILQLNEFCSTPMECQPQLLDVLESSTREYSRLGESRKRRAECMFIFSDNIDPLRATAPDFEKRLIPGLADRAAGLRIQIPPLRDRRSDIPVLVDHFLAAANSQGNRFVVFKDDVREAFESADWKAGNVRQLKQRVESLVVVLDDGEYAMGDICKNLSGTELADLERDLGADPGRWRIKPVWSALSGDLTESLIALRVQMFEENSSAWRSLSGTRNSRQPEEGAVFALLCRAVQESPSSWLADLASDLSGEAPSSESEEPSDVVISWLSDLRRALHDRESNNPATHLHLCALLFLVLSPNHTMDRKDIERVSGRGNTQAASLEGSLIAAAATGVRSFLDGTKRLLMLGPGAVLNASPE